ncbi:glycosyltransferase family 2 protein [uncultured Cohaesibacter sp.]|uniref:glycosyltransferase n=1 Tax=uncultured Cohaesibacter sp. TaxID=1002546 RepID=UPI0029C8F154|nr:glycosyltransferase family 2 protein [uncultured Cohaesibacter sp.]
MTKISAVVCVHNREDTLDACLSALERQTLSKDLHEILVVDNASTDQSPQIADAYVKRNANFKYIREERLGLAIARNRGIREVCHDVVAFTDDDAIPADDWLERLSNRFSTLDEKTVAVGGELDPVWPHEKPEWLKGKDLLRSLSVELHWSDIARHLGADEWLCEANSAYRIAPILERGGFPEKLGRIGNNLLSGENAVNELLLRDGYRFFFDPEIRVKHQIAPQRMTQEWFRRRYFWQGVTGYIVQQYLRENGCDVPPSTSLLLPMNEKSWLSTLNYSESPDFEETLIRVYSLGYALAAANILAGR